MGYLTRDLQAATLRLRKNPVLSLVILLTLALCIGTSTALFSIIKGALIDPWPYKSPDRIVVLNANFPKLGQSDYGAWSIPEYIDLSRQKEIFDAVIAGVAHEVNLTDGDQPEHIHSVQMTANAFRMLGVSPLLGRVFTAAEDVPGGEKVAVMSYGLWQRRYGSDPGVIGKSLLLAGESYKIIGVMPRRFAWWSADLWFPIGLDMTSTDRSQRRLTVQGHLLPGISLTAAKAQLTGLARRLQGDYLATNPEYEGFNFNLRLLTEEVLRDVRPSLIVLLCFMIVVYLMACFNIANLLLAEAVARQREMAVRTAMGAQRGHLVRQLLVESLVLSIPGGLLGLGVAVLGVRLVLSLIPANYMPSEAEITVDGWTVIFSVVLALLAGVLCGLAPAREASRPDSLKALREGGPRSTGTRQVRRFQDLLVVAEVVMSLVVLAAAGLMIQSYLRLTAIDPGYDPQKILTLRIALPADRYPQGRQVADFVNQLLHQVEALPGVESAGATNSLPLTNGPSTVVTLEGVSAADLGVIPDADARVVTPGFLKTLRIPLRQGRSFGDQDVEGALPVALVNESMVRRFWHGRSPLGQRLKMGDATSQNPWLTVVGVVGDVREHAMDTEPRQEFYMAHAQRAFRVRDLAVAVRSSVKPENLTQSVRKVVLGLDPSQPIHRVQTMEEIVINSLGAKRLTLVLLAIFGLTSLFLALIGIFAVLSNQVNNRQQEIGIRMAMGAQLGEVTRLFVRHGMRLTLIGLALGLFAALLSSRVLSNLVYGVSTSDPWTFAGIVLLFAPVAALASYVPARRAARVDPTVSLHAD